MLIKLHLLERLIKEQLQEHEAVQILGTLAEIKEEAKSIAALTESSENGLAVMINRILEVQPEQEKKAAPIIIVINHIKVRPKGGRAKTYKVAKNVQECREFLQEAKAKYIDGEVWIERKKSTNINLN